MSAFELPILENTHNDFLAVLTGQGWVCETEGTYNRTTTLQPINPIFAANYPAVYIGHEATTLCCIQKCELRVDIKVLWSKSTIFSFKFSIVSGAHETKTVNSLPTIS